MDAHVLTIARMAAGLLCFCAMATCILWAVVIGIDRVEKVNARLSLGEKIGYPLGFIGPERNWRFEEEYERLFPDRSQRRKERWLWLFGAISLVGFAFCAAPLF